MCTCGGACRYGPPPAYPRLRVPGLNAPIPAGASYGYQPGGWGRPPVDESGKLLFQAPDEEPEEEELQQFGGQAGDMWGELPPDAEVQQEEEEEGEYSYRWPVPIFNASWSFSSLDPFIARSLPS